LELKTKVEKTFKNLEIINLFWQFQIGHLKTFLAIPNWAFENLFWQFQIGLFKTFFGNSKLGFLKPFFIFPN
jgi:hypothetical protein